MYLELDRLSKQFDGKYAVHDLSLGLEEGGLLCILGSSGCGKTTTLNMIGGFLKPNGGRVLLDGQDITALPPERRPVSTVFQSYGLFPHMSVLQNVTYGLKFRGYSRTEAKEKGRRYLNLVGLAERENARIGELSGGQQQRVAIARALVKMPRVLLLDEPLSNLDARLRLQTREEIRKIQRATKITTVFVTHDQEEAMSISDMIVVMKNGVVQQIGKPQNVYDDPVNLFVAKFLGTPPINVFSGEVKNEQLYIGSEAVLSTPGVSDQPVHVGIRPEGFILKEDGPLSCDLVRLEVMGRDVSIVSTHEKSQNVTIRSIIDADEGKSLPTGKVHFALKPAKVFLFCTDTEERIRF